MSDPTFDELYPDPLLDLQDQVRDYLEGKAFFAALNIISERSATIANRVEKLQGKAEGLYLAVLTTKGGESEIVKPWAESDISVDVSVVEKTSTNRKEGTAFLTATAIVTQLIRHLHGWKPAIALIKLQHKGFAPESADAAKGILLMTVNFKTRVKFPAAPAS